MTQDQTTPTQDAKEAHKPTVGLEKIHFGIPEAVTVGGIWLTGCLLTYLIVSAYHGDQSVSLENMVWAIMIAVVLVSGAVLFRDLIAEVVRHNMNKDKSQEDW